MGFKKDIGLKGDNYQWLGSMFYIGIEALLSTIEHEPGAYSSTGYLAWEYPTNRLLQRLPLAKYSSVCIIMWGLTLCCMAAVKNFAGAVVVRFFLGVFEAAVTPGFALFTSQVCPNDRAYPELQGLITHSGIRGESRVYAPAPGSASTVSRRSSEA